MRKVFYAVLPALVMVFIISLTVRAEYKHAFVGASKCRTCHMSKKKGDQYGVWKSSKHAKAYETLLTEESKKAAEKAGHGGKAPEENPFCLKCHVTGWDAPAELLGSKYSREEGVTCETCHGPGKDYSPIKIMRDKTAAVENGLIFSKKEDCLTCHNEESPTFKAFDYEAAWKEVAHNNPNNTQ